MDFVAGAIYQNASGQFRVLSVAANTLQLEYATGPQAGRVLTKRTADLDRLATTQVEAVTPSAPDPKHRRRTRPAERSAPTTPRS
jgi:hypothetical protein